MCEASVRRKSITCGQVIIILLRGILALRSSKPVHRCTAVRAEGGRLLKEESEVKARWASYFERLYQADPPAAELDVQGVTIPIIDTPINCDPPLFVETQAVVNRLKWGKAPGICGIHVRLFKKQISIKSHFKADTLFFNPMQMIGRNFVPVRPNPVKIPATRQDYSLLHCFQKDAHKVHTYLKMLKCKRSQESNCN
uniref:Uncharacterized protein n=1 Tax=Eptatretus burgeri TaxID=7764 RepID=A0A8C4Q6R8_EPTBU